MRLSSKVLIRVYQIRYIQVKDPPSVPYLGLCLPMTRSGRLAFLGNRYLCSTRIRSGDHPSSTDRVPTHQHSGAYQVVLLSSLPNYGH